MKDYNFGEKKTENIDGVDCPVWQTPRYLEAKKKVIETLESEKYKDILQESDFWILMNTYAKKTKVMYSGLIISHNGCLKINDTLDKPFNPKALSVNQNGFDDSLVFTYVDDDIYEVGEVNKSNCQNKYPYAMALKRCFDRVVLKKCKLAYAGVYSDSEAEEFKEKPEEQEGQKQNIEPKEEINYRQELINKLKELGLDMTTFAKEHNINSKSTQEDFKRACEELNKETKGA